MRLAFLALILSAVSILAGEAAGQDRSPAAPLSLFDPRLDSLRRASVAWDVSRDRERSVIDQVCLVPDLSTFLEAISDWDEKTYYPILIDDLATTARFLEAFRPSRIIRHPRAVEPLAGDRVWDAATAAVVAAWSGVNPGGGDASRGDRIPRGFGVVSRGVVLSAPAEPLLAGGVALAAARYQPLLRYETRGRYSEILEAPAAAEAVRSINEAVKECAPASTKLGDDCDFVTLALDLAYRYRAESGVNCLDDRLCRDPVSLDRWAFTGRLLGDEKTGVYQAMCAIFLRPESALLFNGYRSDPPWSGYDLRPAASRLSPIFQKIKIDDGVAGGNLRNWRRVTGSFHPYDFFMVNTSGSPTHFDLQGGRAFTIDVAPGAPSIVSIIHSFSAADPRNSRTIAGRWLLGGAYAYHGSVDEPYLQSFRAPRLSAEMIAEGLPLGALLRAGVSEPFGAPWKLIYLGDPLIRLRGRRDARPRVAPSGPSVGSPRYSDEPRPAASATASERVAWCVRAALLSASRGFEPKQAAVIAEESLAALRGELAPDHRALAEKLSIMLLYRLQGFEEVEQVFNSIPPDRRAPDLVALRESALSARIRVAIDRGDFEECVACYRALLTGGDSAEFLVQLTANVSARFRGTPRQRAWFDEVRAGLKSGIDPETAKQIKEQLDRSADPKSRG